MKSTFFAEDELQTIFHLCFPKKDLAKPNYEKLKYFLETYTYSLYSNISSIPIFIFDNDQTRICKHLKSPGIDSKDRFVDFSYWPTRQHRLAESIPCNQFLGSLKGPKLEIFGSGFFI